MQDALTSSLGTAAAASTEFGITVESDPTTEIAGSPSAPPLPSAPASVSLAPIIGGAAGGGVALLLVCALVAVLVFKKPKRPSKAAQQYRPNGSSKVQKEASSPFWAVKDSANPLAEHSPGGTSKIQL